MEDLINVALGKNDADLILKGGNVYNVFTHKVQRVDVAIKNGIIVGLGDYDGKNVVDVSGKYILPGFIDAHMHIESSMLTPAQYAKVAMPHGITTVIADPHEIANVCGEDGLAFMKASAESVPLEIKFMLPSCVPCADFAPSGATLSVSDIHRLAPDFFGIGEMMNYPGVLSCDKNVLGKLVKGKIVDGHAPLLSGKELNAYAACGIRTDHECSTPQELQERIERGMFVMVREGSLSKDIKHLIRGIDRANSHRCLFCTDDRHVSEIVRKGTIDYCISKSVRLGLDVADAINMATHNAAECYRLHTGAIAPSYPADLVVCDELVPSKIRMVYKSGVLVARDGISLFECENIDNSKVENSVHIEPVNAEFFAHTRDEKTPCIELLPKLIITKKVYCKKDATSLNKACVIFRHKPKGNHAIAYISNYGLKNGAVAMSIGHDSHNVVVVGDNDADMALAVNTLGTSGGISFCKNGKVENFLPLEIAGLMSKNSGEEVIKIHDALYEALRHSGVNPEIDPLLSLAFVSLPVIPEIRITSEGLFDVTEWKFIN